MGWLEFMNNPVNRLSMSETLSVKLLDGGFKIKAAAQWQLLNAFPEFTLNNIFNATSYIFIYKRTDLHVRRNYYIVSSVFTLLTTP